MNSKSNSDQATELWELNKHPLTRSLKTGLHIRPGLFRISHLLYLCEGGHTVTRYLLPANAIYLQETNGGTAIKSGPVIA